MVNSRDLKDLHPKVKDLCEKFISKCKEQGINILITSTYRDKESQDALYAQGRTSPGNKVTNAKGGQSFHNWRVAFDFVPLVNNKPDWNNQALFKQCGKIAVDVGLEWAGNWKKSFEMAHCQYTGGLSLEDLQAGKEIK